MRVLVETSRFRLVAQDGTVPRFHLEVRSGRLTGNEEWYRSHHMSDWEGFGQDLGRQMLGKAQLRQVG